MPERDLRHVLVAPAQTCLWLLLRVFTTGHAVPLRSQGNETRPLRLPFDYIVPDVSEFGLEIPDGSDHDSAMAFALQLRAKSTMEEQKVLLTMLKGRSMWAAEAPALLADVMTRDVEAKPRRLVGGTTECSAKTTERSCVLEKDDDCNPCYWRNVLLLAGVSSECVVAECYQYSTEAECCANERNILTGCTWEYNSCSAAYLPSTPAYHNAESCPPVDCVTCLKNHRDTSDHRTTQCAAIRAARTGACNTHCEDVAHCDGEVECLLFRTKRLDPCMTHACPPPPAHPSCANAYSTDPTPQQVAPTNCDEQCDDMQAQCGSCGEKVCAQRRSGEVMGIVVLIIIVCIIIGSIIGCVICCCCCCKNNNNNKLQAVQPVQGQVMQVQPIQGQAIQVQGTVVGNGTCGVVPG